jgi:hypothetical protein|tara:strand:+ start:1656 stop:2126 length:471 start_codon:yes stop_codon:yes gene_type:complete
MQGNKEEVITESGSLKNERWFEPSILDAIISFNGKTSFSLNFSDSVSTSEYYLANNVIDSITKVSGNWHERSISIENYLLKTNNPYSYLDSAGLDLKLKNGNWLRAPIDTLVDEVGNSFEHYFKEHGYYSKRTQWFEGNRFKLVNDLYDEITNLFG